MRIKMQKSEKGMTINGAMEDYKRHMIVNNSSVWTMDLVKRVYKNFNEFLDNEDFLVSDVNNRMIEDYIIWLKEKNNKDTTYYENKMNKVIIENLTVQDAFEKYQSKVSGINYCRWKYLRKKIKNV